MIDHEFLQGGQIHEADLREVLDLTAVGDLEWGRVEGYTALGTNVGRVLGWEVAEEANLVDVRAGFNPPESNPASFNYVRLTDRDGRQYYVAEDENPELIPVAQRVLDLGLIAVTVPGGRLSGRIEACASGEHDDRESGHITVYNAPHGIAGAVMGGSERHICVQCSHTTPVAAHSA